MRKILSFILVLTLILNMGATVFAASNDSALSLKKLSENSYLIKSGDEFGILTVKETAKGTTLTVEDNESGEVEGYFYFNKIDDTIYSSYTGKTISVSEINSNNDIMPMAVGDVVARSTYGISYATLSEMVTPTSTQIGIASAMITIVAAAGGIAIATGAAVVVALLSTPLWDVIRNGIISEDTRHGVRVVVATVEIERSGDKGYRYDIESVSTY